MADKPGAQKSGYEKYVNYKNFSIFREIAAPILTD